MQYAKAKKLLWGFWSDYVEVVLNGRIYAKVGERFFTQHAVERMAPRAFKIAAGRVVGRGVTAQAVEAAIVNGTKRISNSEGSSQN